MDTPPLPRNLMTVTATIIVGDITHTTSILVQTHLLNELDEVLQLAWKATKSQATGEAYEGNQSS